jgi:polyketide cyclase/dehydrase/lipid transport protein
MKVAVEVGLPVPMRDAWSVLLDWEGQPSWMSDADHVLVVSPHREGVGVRIDVKSRVLSVPLFTERLEVVAWDPPRRLLMAHRSFIGGCGEWVLEPAGSGCRFRWTEELSLGIPVLGELALLAYRPFMRRLMQRATGELRRLVESRHSNP